MTLSRLKGAEFEIFLHQRITSEKISRLEILQSKINLNIAMLTIYPFLTKSPLKGATYQNPTSCLIGFTLMIILKP